MKTRVEGFFVVLVIYLRINQDLKIYLSSEKHQSKSFTQQGNKPKYALTCKCWSAGCFMVFLFAHGLGFMCIDMFLRTFTHCFRVVQISMVLWWI